MSEEKIKKLEATLQQARSEKERCSLLIDLAMELRHSNTDASLNKANEALMIADQINFSIGKARACFCIGLDYFNLSDYEKSFVFLDRAYQIFEKAGDKWGTSNALNNIGLIHFRLGDYSKALDNFSASLEIKKVAHDNYGTANVLVSMAVIHCETGNPAGAIALLNESLRFSREIKSETLISKTLMELGVILLMENKFSEATEKFEEARQLFKKQNNFSGIAKCLLHLGKVKSASGDLAFALSLFEEGKKLAEETGDKSLLIHFLCIISASKTKDPNEAISLLNEAKTIALKTHEKPLLKMIAAQLSERYESAGKLREALSEFKNFIALKDEINSVETAGQLRNQQISARVATLEQDKKLLELEKFAAVESVRSRISRDMHDEIGSGLTKISLLNERLKLKLGALQEPGNPLLDRISSTSREIMGSLNEIIWSTNPKHDNLAGMLAYFRNYISNFMSETAVGYTIEFPDFSEEANSSSHEEVGEIPILPDLRRNLFLVLKESLNNIMKYAAATNVQISFDLNGTLPRINLEAGFSHPGQAANKTHFHFEISDNGKGISEEKKNKFGNGLRNMKHRIESVNGNFEIISTENKGTRIVIKGEL